MGTLKPRLSLILSFIVVSLIFFSVENAQAYRIDYEHYLFTPCDGCTYIQEEDGLVNGPKIYSDEISSNGDPNAGNSATVRYFANLDTGTLAAYAYCTGGLSELWPFGYSATGRVERISFGLTMTFVVPAGNYPDGLDVSVSGVATGVISSDIASGAQVDYSVSFGGVTESPDLMSIGIDDANTLSFNDPFFLTKQIVWPGTELTESHEYNLSLNAGLSSARTWAVLQGTSPNYVTGAAEIDIYHGDNRIQFDEVVVPEGVTWHTDTGVFLDEGSVSAVRDVLPKPKLAQNYPNPFNPMTSISYYLPETTHVDLVVFDVAGRLVKVLEEGTLDDGHYTNVWHGQDESGKAVASGVYYYRLHAGDMQETRKMTLVK